MVKLCIYNAGKVRIGQVFNTKLEIEAYIDVPVPTGDRVIKQFFHYCSSPDSPLDFRIRKRIGEEGA